MITDKAWQLSEKARKEKSVPECRIYSSEAFQELFATCAPTIQEFDNFSNKLIMDGATLWKLVLMVPIWEKANGNN